MKVLAVIPARGGSKGIKNKNIIDFNGAPLIARTIKAAIDSGVCSEIIVSTEDAEIAEISQKYGASVPFLRSADLAADSSKTIDAVIEVLQKYRELNQEFDILILLQPTSPLRTAQNIKEAFHFFLENQQRSLVSVTESKPPILMRTLNEKNEVENLLKNNKSATVRRQDLGKSYAVNGAIYINNVHEINEETSFNDNEIGYVMEMKNSIDIDDEEDLQLAKIIDRALNQ